MGESAAGVASGMLRVFQVKVEGLIYTLIIYRYICDIHIHIRIYHIIYYIVCVCVHIYIYAHYFHIMKFGRQNNSVSCILMYFGVVECCIPILFLGLHVAQLTQSLLCFTAQASC